MKCSIMQALTFSNDGSPPPEKASIDEAFIDFTRPVREEILRRYPYLAEVPLDASEGKDSPLPPPPPISWAGLGTVIPVVPQPEGGDDSDSKVATDDAAVQEDDEAITWHDVALSIAAEMTNQIRQDIHTKLGYTTSAVWSRSSCADILRFTYI